MALSVLTPFSRVTPVYQLQTNYTDEVLNDSFYGEGLLTRCA